MRLDTDSCKGGVEHFERRQFWIERTVRGVSWVRVYDTYWVVYFTDCTPAEQAQSDDWWMERAAPIAELSK